MILAAKLIKGEIFDMKEQSIVLAMLINIQLLTK